MAKPIKSESSQDLARVSFGEICRLVGQKQSGLGGGSVIALSGALASSLGIKILNFSLKGENNSDKVLKLESWLERAEKTTADFLELAAEDGIAYARYLQDKQVFENKQAIISVPLVMAEKANNLMTLAGFLIKEGKQSFISDSRGMLELATACFYGALETVRINLPLIKGKAWENQIREKIENLLDSVKDLVAPS
ncbi:MAG: cyclodeaminase/cyclohydrolase family protein [Candidatus Pacebacteria bacterium]|nr:cyclodeaminase/cyclohydrolase family protein [Candidatus Paceibacterota bacterium]